MEILLNRIRDAVSRDILSTDNLMTLLQDSGKYSSNVAALTPEAIGFQFYSEASSTEQWRERVNLLEQWFQRDAEYSNTVASQFLVSRILSHRYTIGLDNRSDPNVIRNNISIYQDYLDCLDRSDPSVRDFLPRTSIDVRLDIIWQNQRLYFAGAINAMTMMGIRTNCLKLIEDCQNPAFQPLATQLAKAYMRLADIDGALANENYFFFEQMQHYSRADAIFENLRGELSILGADTALRQKGSWGTTQQENRFLVSQALFALQQQHRRSGLLGFRGRQIQVAKELWNWVQRSKARALLDMLSLENQLPKELQDRLQDNEQTRAKFVSWKEKKRAIDSLERQQATSDLLSVREELENLEKEMKTDSTLSEMLDLAKGRAVTVAEMVQLLKLLPEDKGRRIVLVDWFQIAPTLPYHLLILRMDGVPTLIQLDSSLNEKIAAWIENYLGAEKPAEKRKPWSDAFKDLQDLRALVQPLQDVTSPEDILVFSPTNLLHRLPLHALKVTVPNASNVGETTNKQGTLEDCILLRRNSIIYTQSMSLFRLSVASNTRPSTLTRREKIAIGSPLTLGEACVDAFEDVLRFDRISMDRLNRSRIIDDWNDASFVYFFGHVHDMGKKDQLKTHLLLAVDEREAIAACPGFHEPEMQLTVNDILQDLKFQEGAHVFIVACGSGVQYASPGDDMLGLVTALFFAGARTTTTTLWPVNAFKARIWTEFVVNEWNTMTMDSSSPIDIGVCIRHACLTMIDEYGEENLVDWAPYVHHGWPFPGI
jgi:hypothetical protein